MWIHAPSLIFQPVQELAELNSESERLSLLEQFCTWKSKPVSRESWRNIWKTNSSIRRLSGILYQRSSVNRGVEKWISSLPDSPAHLGLLRVSEEGPTMNEISGQTSPDLSESSGFQFSLGKMFMESTATTTTPYDPNFERWVSRLRREFSLRKRSAHLIRESGFSLWPTVTQDAVGMRTKRYAQGGNPLSRAVILWPTHTVMEAGKVTNRANYGQIGLSNHPALVGYPSRAKMQKSQLGDGQLTDPDSHHSHHSPKSTINGDHSFQRIPYSNQQSAQTHQCSQRCRRLSAIFCEHLMGFPPLWTFPFVPQGTQWFRRWRQSLSRLLQTIFEEEEPSPT